MPEQPRDERQDRKEARQQRISERVERAHAIMADIRSRMTDEEYNAQLNALLEERRIMDDDTSVQPGSVTLDTVDVLLATDDERRIMGELEDELRRHNELVARMTEAERAEYERISAMYDRNH